MTSTPRLTIVTPSFNSGTKLLDTHTSIASQGVDFEYLIMDGVSTDQSLEIARELEAKDRRIAVHSGKDTGVYDAMNKAVALARGDYLYFIGAGDVLLPNALQSVLKLLPDDLRSFIYGDCMLGGRRYDGEFTSRRLFDGNICHQGIFYGRDIFKICGLFNCKYRAFADWEFNQRCFGSRRIKKIYIPVLVAEFESGGISSLDDAAFKADLPMLVRKNLGWTMSFQIWAEPIWWRFRQRLGRIKRKLFA